MKSRMILLFIIVPWLGWGTEPEILNEYIQAALSRNLALQQQEFSYQKSMAALSEARGKFFPSIAIGARYSRAGGGRQIDIPVGDLVNPIYQTLNFLLQQNVFPENIQNETIPFLREEEQETKIRAVQPIFEPKIYYNYQMKDKMQKIERVNRNVYSRSLIAEVKAAYFNYLKTRETLKFIERTRELIEENMRVSEKLVANHKVTQEVIFRARADLSLLESRAAEAEKGQDMAQAYLNFLLNQSASQPVRVISRDSLPPVVEMLRPEAEEFALRNREETHQLELGIELAKDGIKLNRSDFLPQVFLVFDYGFQGEFYRFSKQDDFWMASALLEWNLFNGFQDKAKIQQAVLEKKRLQSRQMELENQIRLQVRDAHHGMVVARKHLQSTRDRVASETKSFEIVDKKYREGMALQVEYLDARNNYLSSEIDLILSIFDYQIKYAEFEKTVASYPLPPDFQNMEIR